MWIRRAFALFFIVTLASSLVWVQAPKLPLLFDLKYYAEGAHGPLLKTLLLGLPGTFNDPFSFPTPLWSTLSVWRAFWILVHLGLCVIAGMLFWHLLTSQPQPSRFGPWGWFHVLWVFSILINLWHLDDLPPQLVVLLNLSALLTLTVAWIRGWLFFYLLVLGTPAYVELAVALYLDNVCFLHIAVFFLLFVLCAWYEWRNNNAKLV